MLEELKAMNDPDPEQELVKRVDAWILKLQMPNDLSNKQ